MVAFPMVTVVAGILERGGAVLVCQRPHGKLHPLKWEFPGGKVEPGETPADALRRELREELAIEVTVGPEMARYEYAYANCAPMLLIFFRINAFQGEPRNLAFERLTWEQPPHLPAYDFLEGDAKFIRSRALEGYN